MTDDRAAQSQAREMMERQLGQMVRLIDDLLDISRISCNKFELRKACISLASVIENAVETARPSIDAKRQAIRCALRPIQFTSTPISPGWPRCFPTFSTTVPSTRIRAAGLS